MLYHGRPLELTVAMLGMAYPERQMLGQGVDTAVPWNQQLLDKLEAG
jgi:hypothetical protein